MVIDDATGKAACPPFDDKRTHMEVYEFWPSDLQRVFQQAGMPRRRPPVNDACNNNERVSGTPPRITSPLRGSIYAIRMKRRDEDRIAFSANGDAATRTLYWFVNDAYVGSSAPGQSLFWQPAAAGNYDVRVIDDRGMSDTRPLGVSLVE